MTLTKMGPLMSDHPLVFNESCPSCSLSFRVGDYVTLVALGPGDDPEARAKARDGRPYNATAVPVHWACATGEEDEDGH